jgi:DUF4097 and DUF4098 domain-containing protein YvlB
MEVAMSQEIVENVFNVPERAKLTLSNVRGSVVVRRGEEGEISVKAVKHVNSGDDDTEISMEQENGHVRVETRHGSSFGWFGGKKPCKIDYDVRVPARCSIDLSGVSNTCRVMDISGDIVVKSVSGDIYLANLTGDINVKGVSSNVSADGLDGVLIIDTVSGSGKVTASNLGEVNAKTVSGDMRFELTIAKGPYNFNSVSGNVRLYLPKGSGCTVKASTMSGSIRTNHEVTRRETRGHRKSVEINGGGVPVTFKSLSGDIRLEVDKADEVAPYQDEGPSADAMSILEDIENGRITVDEALSRLQ